MLNMELTILVWTLLISSVFTEDKDTYQCVVIQEKELIKDHVEIPSFLKNNRTQCQVPGGDHEMLRCGQTDIYIRPECVCSFHNVYEGRYHPYSSCPEGAESDIVTQLKCSNCEKYSLNNNGPCINGGKLICKGEKVAPELTCECPHNYEGAFCEKKIENIYRICDKISANYSHDLDNCSDTWRECVTYSRNRRHAYRCRSDTSQVRPGLPLCQDTDTTTLLLPEIRKEPEGPHVTWAGTIYFFMFLFLVLCAFTDGAGSRVLEIMDEAICCYNATM